MKTSQQRLFILRSSAVTTEATARQKSDPSLSHFSTPLILILVLVNRNFVTLCYLTILPLLLIPHPCLASNKKGKEEKKVSSKVYPLHPPTSIEYLVLSAHGPMLSLS